MKRAAFHYGIGWTGIKVFFTNSDLGTCSYAYFNLKASHGAVQLNKETTEYLVNDKASSKYIVGSYRSGLIYGVNWFGKNDMSELECANMHFDKTRMKKVITLAGKIDKNQN